MLHLAILIVLYFFPSILAHDKRDATGIFLLNLFLGWTVLGWLIALIWACMSESYTHVRLIPATAGGRYCSQCGTVAYPNAHFCTACGRTV
jgi:Superinfection immunity protein